jgi:hypothetical protein
MAVEALICLPALDLVAQNEARLAAHRLWGLEVSSYLHPNRGNCSILMRLQQSDPLFSMGVDVMRPAFNLEPKYRVTMLTKADGQQELALLLQSKDSYGLQTGPG